MANQTNNDYEKAVAEVNRLVRLGIAVTKLMDEANELMDKEVIPLNPDENPEGSFVEYDGAKADLYEWFFDNVNGLV